MKGITRLIAITGILAALLLPSLCRADGLLTIDSSPLLSIGTVDTPYTDQFLSASGGTPPYAWKATGILPPGITVSPAGVVSGTPTSGGTFNFMINVTDAVLSTASKQMFLNISSPRIVMPETMPSRYSDCTNCHVQQTPGAPVTALSGTPQSPSNSSEASFSFTTNVPDYTLKSECSMDGALFAPCESPANYTSLSDGPHTFMVRSIGNSGEIESPPVSFTWSIYTAPLVIVTDTLPNGTMGIPYSQTLSATGGVPPLTWYIPPGYLPTGLNLDPATGFISGTPTTPGNSWFTVQATDSFNSSVTKQLGIQIQPQPLSITTASLPVGSMGTGYNVTLTANGGVSPYSWSIDSGSLPAGLTLNGGSGLISGTPTDSGRFQIVFKATDTTFVTATRLLTIETAHTNFPTLQYAFDHVVDGDIVMALAASYGENLVLAMPVAITLKGGYDPAYTSNPGMTFVEGLTVMKGSLTVENVAVR